MTNQRLVAATREACTDDRRGKPSPGSGRRPTINYEQVRQLTQQGHTAEHIAHQLGCSTSAITKIRIRLGITTDYNRPLTPEKRALIEAAIKDGWSQAEICRTHHIAPDTMRRHYPQSAWTPEQRAEHMSTLRLARTDCWGALQRKE